jgi:hypothetical protein
MNGTFIQLETLGGTHLMAFVANRVNESEENFDVRVKDQLIEVIQKLGYVNPGDTFRVVEDWSEDGS